MKPARELVRHAPGAEAIALASAGGVYAVYLTGAGGSYLLLDVQPGRYRAEWIRPEDGSVIESGGIDHKEGLLRLSTPPFQPDAALKLVRVR
jgi:hypothetical protein